MEARHSQAPPATLRERGKLKDEGDWTRFRARDSIVSETQTPAFYQQPPPPDTLGKRKTLLCSESFGINNLATE